MTINLYLYFQVAPELNLYEWCMCVFKEFLKCTVDVADLFGLYITMSKIPGRGELKLLVAALGE